MLTKSEAQRIAERCIDPRRDALDPDSFLETEHCFVFGWNSKAFLRTGNMKEAMFGNSPIIISKHDGSFVDTGTAVPAEYYVRRYERRFKRPWWKLW